MTDFRKAALAALLLLPAASAVAGPTPEPMHFKKETIDLPTSDRMFAGGSGADVVNNNCLACHSAGMVLTQPKLTKAQWTETVNKMIHVYKAPVDASDVTPIVNYLAELKPAP